MSKWARALNKISKASSLVATFSTIFPLKNTGVAWAGVSGAFLSLITKLAEEIIHQRYEDDRNPCKSGINTVNRIALLTITCLEALPTLAKDQELEEIDMLPLRLMLLSLWAATVCLDFGIPEERDNFRYC